MQYSTEYRNIDKNGHKSRTSVDSAIYLSKAERRKNVVKTLRTINFALTALFLCKCRTKDNESKTKMGLFA